MVPVENPSWKTSLLQFKNEFAKYEDISQYFVQYSDVRYKLNGFNYKMKNSVLTGVTLNTSVRTKFFLIAPELAQLSDQANCKWLACLQRHKIDIIILQLLSLNAKTRALINFWPHCGTLAIHSGEGYELFNLVTKAVMPEKVENDLCQQSDIGRAPFETFVKDRIH